jgi:hypothetical protein
MEIETVRHASPERAAGTGRLVHNTLCSERRAIETTASGHQDKLMVVIETIRILLARLGLSKVSGTERGSFNSGKETPAQSHEQY